MRFEGTKNKQKNTKQKMGSILLIMILVCSALISTLVSNPKFKTTMAESTWTQTSDKDFKNGTLNNTTIKGNDDNAELVIDLPKLNEWNKEIPAISPGLSYGHAMATIYTTKKVLLFGGTDGLVTCYNDTWLFDSNNKTWTNMSPSNNPGARYYHAMAPIWGTDKVVLFGGNAGFYRNDTWVYDLSDNTWTMKTPSTIPLTRQRHAMASIFGEDKVMLFGGEGYDAPYVYKDTWIYDLSNDTWTNMMPINKPSGRYLHAMATFHNTDKILMFGGSSGSTEYDTWIYDFSDNNWTQRSPSIYPSGRWGHTLAPIWGTDEILLFGGYESAGIVNDTWVYTYSNNSWTERNLSNRPSKRYMHSMASINGTDQIVLYGGYFDTGTSNETWLYEHVLPTINGTFISNPFDTKTNSSFKIISWFSKTPENTSIKIQLRTALTEQDLLLREFVGPEGSNTFYYNSTPSNIWSGHEGDRWIQYKAFFNISTYTDSPTLKDISIIYNCLPTTRLLGPVNGSYVAENEPTFSWVFNDLDSEGQKAFQVLIDDDIGFQDLIYDSGEQISSKQSWEFPTGTNYTYIPDGTWYWKVRTQDPDGAWTKFNKPWIFKIDTSYPSSSITEPINNGFYNNLNEISGMATDPANGSGISKVEIAVKNLNNNYYWNGSDWTSIISWIEAFGKTNWTYDASIIKWISGVSYNVQSRAIDFLNNIENPDKYVIFNYDADNPNSEITFPENNSLLNSLNIINGNTFDIGGAGIENVEICIKSNTTNNYWDGTGWTQTESWNSVAGKNSWSYNASEIQWSTGYRYFVRARGYDKASNMESSVNGITFTFDNEPPNALDISINDGSEYTTDTTILISLRAKDIGSGIAEMAFSINSKDWTPWETFKENKSFELQIGDGEKYIYFKVRDYAGNIAEPIFDLIILDTTPPAELIIIINDNAKYTNNKNVIVTLAVTDALSGLDEMCFSYDGVNWLLWESFKYIKSLSLLPGDGDKRIFAKVKDKLGNTADPVYDSIILDSNPPHSLSIIVNDGKSHTNSTSVNLVMHAKDNASGVDKISFSIDGENWSTWEDFTQLRTYGLPFGDGRKTIYFKANDKAGNIADPVSDSIILSTSKKNGVGDSPDKSSSDWDFWTVFAIIILIIIILIMIGIVIVKNRKKRVQIELQAKSAKLVSIKEGETLIPVVSLGKIPATLELPPLPGTTAIAMSDEGQPTAGITPTPVLAAPGQSTQPSIPTLMTNATQLPQLPPVQNERTDNTAKNNHTSTSTSTQAQLKPPIDNTPQNSTTPRVHLPNSSTQQSDSNDIAPQNNSKE